MVKRVISWLILSVFLTVFVHGCAYVDDLLSLPRQGQVGGVTGGSSDDGAGAGRDTDKDVDKENASEAGTAADEGQAAETPGTDGQAVQGVSELYYAYHKLDEGQQETYMEVLDALIQMKTDAILSAKDKSDLDLIFNCVMNDHPELFYVEGYKVTEYTRGGKTESIAFGGTYSMTSEEALQTKARIDGRVEECFRDVPLNEDEYSTVLFLYEWVINNTDYDRGAENNQNICSVFLQGKSVCQGYAKSMQYMLQKAGIPCLIVTGFTNGERHAWNLVMVDGDYYYLDPTWGDASYASGSAGNAAGGFEPSINYDYFLVTTDEITRTHSIEKVVELPLCLATDDNYFVREGLYFDSYDEDGIAAAFDSEKAKSDGYVTIKCASSEGYDVMVGELIGSQKVFDFLDSRGTNISYSLNDKLRTISFWNLTDGAGT